MELTFSIALTLLLFACDTEKQQATPFEPEKEVALIGHQMLEQESAWNAGELEVFMKHYWKSDSLKFIGSRGLTYGWQSTLDNYKKSYPDAMAMGHLKFTNLAIDVLDPTNAYVIGKWELFRIADTLSGHYTLLWKKIEKNWVIVADHSS